jgi:hypothetical protein
MDRPRNMTDGGAGGAGGAPVSDHPAARRLTVVLLVVLVAAFGWWIAWVVRTDQPLDYWTYVLTGETYAHHQDPYALSRDAWFAEGDALGLAHFAWPYRYPPYTAAFFRAVNGVDHEAVLVAWLLASAAALIGAAVISAAAFGGRWRVPLALGLLLLLSPAWDTLLLGQVNGFVLLALALGLWAIMRAREALLGAMVAVATSVKVSPLVLLGWLLWRRRWRATLAAAVTLAALTVVSAPILGWHAFVSYAHHGLDLARPTLVITGGANVTLVGAVGRLLPGEPSLAKAIGYSLAALVALCTLALCRPWGREPRGGGAGEASAAAGATTARVATAAARRRLAYEYCLILAALPLLPSFTWFHQLVFSFVPLFVLAVEAWEGEERGLLCALAALLALADLFWLYAAPLMLHGVYAPDWFWRLSLDTLFALGVWGACARLVWTRTRRAHAPSPALAPDAAV